LDSDSTLLVYMNGHGGDNYFKIQDTDAFTDDEFAKALNELAGKLEYDLPKWSHLTGTRSYL
jgi:glycosylphosphatidylinositol transamidase (GPIT) subunit GPI8